MLQAKKNHQNTNPVRAGIRANVFLGKPWRPGGFQIKGAEGSLEPHFSQQNNLHHQFDPLLNSLLLLLFSSIFSVPLCPLLHLLAFASKPRSTVFFLNAVSEHYPSHTSSSRLPFLKRNSALESSVCKERNTQGSKDHHHPFSQSLHRACVTNKKPSRRPTRLGQIGSNQIKSDRQTVPGNGQRHSHSHSPAGDLGLGTDGLFNSKPPSASCQPRASHKATKRQKERKKTA